MRETRSSSSSAVWMTLPLPRVAAMSAKDEGPILSPLWKGSTSASAAARQCMDTRGLASELMKASCMTSSLSRNRAPTIVYDAYSSWSVRITSNRMPASFWRSSLTTAKGESLTTRLTKRLSSDTSSRVALSLESVRRTLLMPFAASAALSAQRPCLRSLEASPVPMAGAMRSPRRRCIATTQSPPLRLGRDVSLQVIAGRSPLLCVFAQ
mmetsp:Transcript_41346/g.99340  ORF Transcript_41346/g.99340 Transcript_41346/m.99340 type:complete len:210 (+) Transcript_41346:216-845(+)